MKLAIPVVEHLALLLRIREVQGTNLRVFRDFLGASARQMTKQYHKLSHDHFLPHPLQFIIH
jgi:hypothetical protein